MADAFVTFPNNPQLTTPGNVTGGGAIGKDEFLAEFKVRVVNAGCYAIIPTLRSYSRLPSFPLDTDSDVAYVRGAKLHCYCFKAQEEKTFYVTGDGAAPPGKELKPNDPNAKPLDDLQGKWPKSDLPFNNLELYLLVKVALCRAGECKADKNCGEFLTNDDDEQKIVGKAKSERQKDAKIQGGPTTKDLAKELVEEAIKAAGKPK
ncbi:MAG TPA: hypothetical protein VE715_16625 [Blastocatellia bacterium]|nr:hypothetical protein [Blastocatellia bacterium]